MKEKGSQQQEDKRSKKINRFVLDFDLFSRYTDGGRFSLMQPTLHEKMRPNFKFFLSHGQYVLSFDFTEELRSDCVNSSFPPKFWVAKNEKKQKVMLVAMTPMYKVKGKILVPCWASTNFRQTEILQHRSKLVPVFQSSVVNIDRMEWKVTQNVLIFIPNTHKLRKSCYASVADSVLHSRAYIENHELRLVKCYPFSPAQEATDTLTCLI